MKCIQCGSEDVTVNVVNEVTMKDKHHGILWWVFIGWWWIPVKWCVFFVPALLIKIFGHKKQKAINTTVTKCVCQSCGYTWNV